MTKIVYNIEAARQCATAHHLLKIVYLVAISIASPAHFGLKK